MSQYLMSRRVNYLKTTYSSLCLRNSFYPSHTIGYFDYEVINLILYNGKRNNITKANHHL